MKISQKQVSFKNASGERLVGTLFTPKKPNGRAVVFLHGFNGRHDTPNKLAWMREVANLGFITLGFDFSGCGRSKGKFEETSYSKQVGDAEAAMEYLLLKCKVHEFGLVGHSMGGVDALIAASRFGQVFAVASIAAPYKIHDFPEKMTWMATSYDFSKWMAQGVVELKDGEKVVRLNYAFKEDQWTYEMAGFLPLVKQPVLILHGNRDKVVSVKDASSYAKNLPNATLSLIKGGDHRLRKHTAKVKEALRKFFKKLA